MSQKDVHTNYYAIDPRKVGDVVEKSGKNRPCDAKCGKSQGFLGERPKETVATSYVRSTCVQRKRLGTACRRSHLGMVLDIMSPGAGVRDPGLVAPSAY
jgi:hypothetical protein